MDEKTIRKIVRDELANECLREGGVYDHCRLAALNMVKPIIEVNMRTIRDDIREEFRPGENA